MTRHTVRRRLITVDEREHVMAVARGSLFSWGCLVVVSVVVALAAALLGGGIGSLVSEQGVTVGRVVGAGAVAVLFIIMVMDLRRRMAARQLGDDLAGGIVEELEVEDPRVLLLAGDHSSVEPALCFEIGEGRLLLLVGQWLWDPATYAAPGDVVRRAGDDDTAAEAYVNGLPPPYAFPCTTFSLVRLPHSGEVLTVRPGGAYVRPDEGPAIHAADYGFPASALLEGSLDRLEDALASCRRS